MSCLRRGLSMQAAVLIVLAGCSAARPSLETLSSKDAPLELSVISETASDEVVTVTGQVQSKTILDISKAYLEFIVGRELKTIKLSEATGISALGPGEKATFVVFAPHRGERGYQLSLVWGKEGECHLTLEPTELQFAVIACDTPPCALKPELVTKLINSGEAQCSAPTVIVMTWMNDAAPTSEELVLQGVELTARSERVVKIGLDRELSPVEAEELHARIELKQ